MLGSLELQVLLAVLRKSGNAYGVSLADELESRTGKRHTLGAIYTTLERLRGKGYVVSRQGEATPERGGRAKLYFEVTAQGHSAVDETLNAVSCLSAGIRRFKGALP